MISSSHEANYTVLVVDDDPDLRELLEIEVGLGGYVVLTADSGRAAEAILQSRRVDAVISDIRMPNGDGVFLLKEIRKRDPVLPVVILITGYADIREAELVALGCQRLYRKPFPVGEMLADLRSMLMPALRAVP